MRAAIVLLFASACYRPNTLAACRVSCASTSDCPGDFECAESHCKPIGSSCPAPGDDAATDTSTEATPLQVCAGSSGPLGEICFDPPPSPKVFDPGTTINTDTSPFCLHPSTIDACVIVTHQLADSIRWIGTAPLVLWSATDLDISGEIDVSSTVTGEVGAGGNFSSCPTVDGVFLNPRGSGGAGGSYSLQGLGGDGGSTTNSPVVMGATAVAPANASATLRGGCPGGHGGSGFTAMGGSGGGVVYLIAKTGIKVSGIINASGGGAPATPIRSGGGGGGSGGLIVFVAATDTVITSSAVLVALGGGGSPGSLSTVAGVAGFDPTTSIPFSATSSTDSSCATSVGGAGSLGDGAKAASGGDVNLGNNCSPGGGGGGDGSIVSYSATTSNMSSHVFPLLVD